MCAPTLHGDGGPKKNQNCDTVINISLRFILANPYDIRV